MKLLMAVIAAIWTLFPAVAAAGTRPVVVELFTSQGCSSCPPADALMQKLSARDDVIALSLHVDYWDYIGWKDTFADPANSKRQNRYARAAGRKMVYTPQMIVNGTDDVVGTRAMELADLITLHKSDPVLVILSADKRGKQVRIHAEAASPEARGPYLVQLVRFLPARTADIARGENAGKTLTSFNVVDRWSLLREWDARRPLNIHASAPGERPTVILIQEPGPGAIVAAVRVR